MLGKFRRRIFFLSDFDDFFLDMFQKIFRKKSKKNEKIKLWVEI